MFAKISRASRENHGAVFKRYIERLIRMGGARDPYVTARIAFFTKAVTNASTSPVSFDIAVKFALLYAGGCLAIKFRLLPWTRAALLSALKNTYTSAVASFPTPDASLSDAKKALLAFLKRLPAKSSLGESGFVRAKGYQFKKSGRTIFVVKRNHFRPIFESDEQQERVLQWLTSTGRLSLARSRSDRNIVKQQHRWPDGERRRSYMIGLNSLSTTAA
jgi:hypothetical protein